MKFGRKYRKDVKGAAAFRSFSSQKSLTFDFTSFLKAYFEGGFSSKESGCGSQYWCVKDLIWKNQDLELSFAVVNKSF